MFGLVRPTALSNISSRSQMDFANKVCFPRPRLLYQRMLAIADDNETPWLQLADIASTQQQLPRRARISRRSRSGDAPAVTARALRRSSSDSPLSIRMTSTARLAGAAHGRRLAM